MSIIGLNMYSFGHSMGLSKVGREIGAKIEVEKCVELAKDLNCSHVEIPVDLFLGKHLVGLEDAVAYAHECGVGLFPALESFDDASLGLTIKALAKCGFTNVRIKMPQSMPVVYGGNRFEKGGFYTDCVVFRRLLDKWCPIAKDHGLRFSIENHQDLTALELRKLCADRRQWDLSINWDVGNSYATLDSPEFFWDVCNEFIGNVHLKDYRLTRVENGLGLSRCCLGSGIVNWSWVMMKVRELSNDIKCSIELGAQVQRILLCESPDYIKRLAGESKKERMRMKCLRDLLIEQAAKVRAEDLEESDFCFDLAPNLLEQKLFDKELLEVSQSKEFLDNLVVKTDA